MAKEPTYPVKKLVYLTDDMAREITEFRFTKRLQSDNEAIRQLLELGLSASKEGS